MITIRVCNFAGECVKEVPVDNEDEIGTAIKQLCSWFPIMPGDRIEVSENE